MTIPEALEHTLPQLMLLARANTRREAAQAMSQLDGMAAAMAVFWGKNGNSAFTKIRRALKKLADQQ